MTTIPTHSCEICRPTGKNRYHDPGLDCRCDYLNWSERQEATSTPDYDETDSLDDAWRKWFDSNPEAVASWRHRNGRWPSDHPNDALRRP